MKRERRKTNEIIIRGLLNRQLLGMFKAWLAIFEIGKLLSSVYKKESIGQTYDL